MAPKYLTVGSTENQGDVMDPERMTNPAETDWRRVMQRRRVWRPPTDVYETDQHVVIKVEVAGMAEEDFDISYVDHNLTIAGRRKDPVGKLIYQNMEIRYGEFRTEVWVSWSLEQAEIEATYEEGFLFVKLPKAQEHHIQIHVRGSEGL